MRVSIKPRDLDLTEPLRAHCVRTVERGFARHSALVRHVQVALSDLNGPRGGADKHCAVFVDLLPEGHLMAEHTGDDAYAAVHRAVSRARRRLVRSRQQRRGSPRARARAAQRRGDRP